MAYNYRVLDLIRLLRTKVAAADDLAVSYRRVVQGRLSVGLKIHCLNDGRQFSELIEGLGGPRRILEINYYKNAEASFCLVLPPVGSVSSAIHLLECIEQFTGSPIFGNQQIQLQLCSPGRLNALDSAILAVGFYLGSDTLRRYSQADLRTTFTGHCINPRGVRLVLYDADGDFDRDFVWWNAQGALEPELPFRNGRTDILIGSASKLDIQNVNLLSTLLVHSEFDGYWRPFGEQLKKDMEKLLDRHLLSGLLAAPWVRASLAPFGDDDRFFAALKELVAYAYGEAVRVKQRRLGIFESWRDIPARSPNGILQEMQDVLSKYNHRLEKQSPVFAGG